MTNELLTLIVAHLACADVETERRLSGAELHYCSAVYEQIKLEFLPGVTAEDVQGLSPKERGAVSRAGFLAFYTWRQDHPELVEHLQRVARGEAVLAKSG